MSDSLLILDDSSEEYSFTKPFFSTLSRQNCLTQEQIETLERSLQISFSKQKSSSQIDSHKRIPPELKNLDSIKSQDSLMLLLQNMEKKPAQDSLVLHELGSEVYFDQHVNSQRSELDIKLIDNFFQQIVERQVKEESGLYGQQMKDTLVFSQKGENQLSFQFVDEPSEEQHSECDCLAGRKDPEQLNRKTAPAIPTTTTQPQLPQPQNKNRFTTPQLSPNILKKPPLQPPVPHPHHPQFLTSHNYPKFSPYFQIKLQKSHHTSSLLNSSKQVLERRFSWLVEFVEKVQNSYYGVKKDYADFRWYEDAEKMGLKNQFQKMTVENFSTLKWQIGIERTRTRLLHCCKSDTPSVQHQKLSTFNSQLLLQIKTYLKAVLTDLPNIQLQKLNEILTMEQKLLQDLAHLDTSLIGYEQALNELVRSVVKQDLVELDVIGRQALLTAVVIEGKFKRDSEYFIALHHKNVDRSFRTGQVDYQLAFSTLQEGLNKIKYSATKDLEEWNAPSASTISLKLNRQFQKQIHDILAQQIVEITMLLQVTKQQHNDILQVLQKKTVPSQGLNRFFPNLKV